MLAVVVDGVVGNDVSRRSGQRGPGAAVVRKLNATHGVAVDQIPFNRIAAAGFQFDALQFAVLRGVRIVVRRVGLDDGMICPAEIDALAVVVDRVVGANRCWPRCCLGPSQR